jgi:prolipoprotein diacylglyceryl transferase
MIEWNVSPEIFQIGSLAPRWYGLMFVVGFLIGEVYVGKHLPALEEEGKSKKKRPNKKKKNESEKSKKKAETSTLLMYLLGGTIIGSRLAHCLFYEPGYYLTQPWKILMVWQGGLASHGGYAGIILATYLYTKRNPKTTFLWLIDLISAPALLTGGFIRLGNLMNSEILGRPSDVAWAFIFKRVDDIPRHPTQVYESIGYFTIAFILYFLFQRYSKTWLRGRILGFAFVLSFSFRFFVEFFKENQVSFEQGLALNMGQILSIPFVLFGLFLIFEGHKRFLKS